MNYSNKAMFAVSAACVGGAATVYKLVVKPVMAHAYNFIADPVQNFGSFMWRTRPEPVVKAWDMILKDLINNTLGFDGWESIFGNILWTLLFMFIFWFIIGTWRWFTEKVRVVSYWVRGIEVIDYQGESMQTGSEFRTTNAIVKGQISIRKNGLFVMPHLGYGARVGNVLVTPAHVLRNHSEVVLAYVSNGVENKVMVSTQGALPSKVAHDLVYLTLSEDIFSKLAAPNARLAKTMPKTIQVSLIGPQGMSSGTLLKTSILGQIRYSGSTLPGCSGALYASLDGIVYGIHNGVMHDVNVGTAATLIVNEIKVRFMGESDPPEVDIQVPTIGKNNWTESDITREIREREEAYNREWHERAKTRTDLWADELDEESAEVDRLRAARLLLRVLQRGNGAFQPHTVGIVNEDMPDEEQEQLALQIVSLFIDNKTMKKEMIAIQDKVSKMGQLETDLKRISDKVLPLMDRMNSLESYCTRTAQGFNVLPAQHGARIIEAPVVEESQEISVAPVQDKPEKPQEIKYQCSCGVVCRTQIRYDNHKQQCRVMKGETTQPRYVDVGKKVAYQKTSGFLGNPASSLPKKKVKTSSKNSNINETRSRYQSEEGILKNFQESLNLMLQLYPNLAKTTVGQDSVVQQN